MVLYKRESKFSLAIKARNVWKRVIMGISTKTRIARSIGRSQGDVFLRAHFADFGSSSRVTRALSELMDERKLVRLGYGVYAKTIPSVVTGNAIPRKVLESLVVEAFNSLGIPMELGAARLAYATGNSNQVPMSVTVSTGSRRVSRKLKLGNREVKYEKPLTRAS